MKALRLGWRIEMEAILNFSLKNAPLIAVIVTLFLALLAHFANAYFQRKANRDQYVNETLVDAYLAIEQAYSRDYTLNSSYRKMEDNWSFELERAIAKLQLLAPSPIANAVSDAIEDGKPFALPESLLKQIRDVLRKQLGLKTVSSEPKFLRFIKKSDV